LSGEIYALAREISAKRVGLAIRICNSAGVVLATFYEGAEVEDREVGFHPLIPQPGARVGYGDVNPALFETGRWDRNIERFIPEIKMDERMPIAQLRLFLD
jgi:hypothetical protein